MQQPEVAAEPDNGSISPLVLIGLSAGGIEPLTEVISGIADEPDVDAPVLVAMHMSPQSPKLLDGVLRRRTSMPVEYAGDGDELRARHVYLTPPNHHMTVEDGRLRVQWGPRHDGYRPSIDRLFRSAARTAHHPLVAILLSGARSDGSDGARAVKAGGGFVVIQDPETAVLPSMIESALRTLEPDAVLDARAIAPYIAKLIAGADPRGKGRVVASGERRRPTAFTCPDCGGVLWETAGDDERLKCRVGHTWSLDGLSGGGSARVENAMWTALEVIEEQVSFDQRLLDRARSTPSTEAAANRIRRRIERRRAAASAIRDAMRHI